MDMSDNLELVTLDKAAQIVGKTPHNIRDYLQRQRISNTMTKAKLLNVLKMGSYVYL